MIRFSPTRRARHYTRPKAARALVPGFAHRAFTLIELLVVIAIISLLAAILFPVFARARENARKSSCANNLKQIGIGLVQYMGDYDGYMMGSEAIGAIGTANVSWPTQVQPYIKSAQVFVCPSGEKSAFAPAPRLVDPTAGGRSRYCGVTTGDGSTGGQGLVPGLSYGRNLIQSANWTTVGFTGGNKYGYAISSATNTPVNEADVEDPAGTIHIFDAITGTSSTTLNPCTQGDSIRSISDEIRTDHYSNSEASKVATRHFEGFNAMFGDGHVKWIQFGHTTASQWSVQKD